MTSDDIECTRCHRFFCRNDKDAMKVYRLYIVYLVLVVFTLLLAVAFAAVLYLFADDFPAMVASNFTQEEVSSIIAITSSMRMLTLFDAVADLTGGKSMVFRR